MSAAGPMTTRYVASEPARGAVHAFIEFARPRGIKLVDETGLIPQELSVLQVSQQIDRWQDVDREQLNAERQAALQPGAACACED